MLSPSCAQYPRKLVHVTALIEPQKCPKMQYLLIISKLFCAPKLMQYDGMNVSGYVKQDKNET